MTTTVNFLHLDKLLVFCVLLVGIILFWSNLRSKPCFFQVQLPQNLIQLHPSIHPSIRSFVSFRYYFSSFSFTASYCRDNWWLKSSVVLAIRPLRDIDTQRQLTGWLLSVCVLGFGEISSAYEMKRKIKFIENLLSEFKNDGVWVGVVHMSHKG